MPRPKIPEWQQTIIRQIIDTLERNYILWNEINEKFTDNGLEDALTVAFASKFSEEKYATVPKDEAGGRQFASDVSKILEDLIGDKHLALQYGPKLLDQHRDILKTDFKFPWELQASDPRSNMSPDEVKKINAESLPMQYGFFDADTTLEQKKKILTLLYPIEGLTEEQQRTQQERLTQRIDDQAKNESVALPENIGYFGMFFVADPFKFDLVREKLFDTLQKLQDKAAIILDLRSNSGGSTDGVRLLLSYFFREPTHINTIIERREGVDVPVPSITYQHGSAELTPVNRRGQPAPDLSSKPLYVLTGNNTFSAAEEISLDLQALSRATLIGQPTRGGANPQMARPLFIVQQGSAPQINDTFFMSTPYGRAENPTIRQKLGPDAKANWEGTGVKPDVPLDLSANPLLTAVRLAQDNLKLVHPPGTLSAVHNATHFPPLKPFPVANSSTASDKKNEDDPKRFKKG